MASNESLDSGRDSASAETSDTAVSSVSEDIRLAWNDRLATRTLDDTAFVLLRSKMVSLNEVGTFVWEYFRDGSTIKDAADAVLAEFDTTPSQALRDVRVFVEDLVRRSLLIAVPPPG